MNKGEPKPHLFIPRDDSPYICRKCNMTQLKPWHLQSGAARRGAQPSGPRRTPPR